MARVGISAAYYLSAAVFVCGHRHGLAVYYAVYYLVNGMGDVITFLTVFILPGAFGGLVRGLVGMAKHVYVKKETIRMSKFLFSLLVAMVVGGVASVLVEGDWRVALLAGFAGSDLLESLYKSRLFGLLK